MALEPSIGNFIGKIAWQYFPYEKPNEPQVKKLGANEGKVRPVVFTFRSKSKVLSYLALPVTSKFKPELGADCFYEIKDLHYCGLNKASWVVLYKQREYLDSIVDKSKTQDLSGDDQLGLFFAIEDYACKGYMVKTIM